MSLETIIRTALLVPVTGNPKDPNCTWGLPVYLEGPPGIGKTARIEYVSNDLGLKCATVFVPVKQPEELGGVLVPDGKGGANQICMLPQVRELVSIGKGVLFLDEINWAGRALQGALMGAVLARTFGDVKLPGQIRIVAAGNAAHETDGGHVMIPPLANRFAWFRVNAPSAEEWNKWRRSRFQRSIATVGMSDLEGVVRDKWADVFPKYDGLIQAFIERREELLHHLPPAGHKDRNRAWSSPRSWDVAMFAATTCEILDQRGMRADFIAACVGEAAAAEFEAFLVAQDLPDPLDMLENGWKPDKRIDRATAAYSAALSYALGREDGKNRRDMVLQMWKLLATACDAGFADLVMELSERLIAAGFSRTAMNESGAAIDKDMVVASDAVLLKLGKSKITRFSSKSAP